jgi:hypothetical protein
MQPFSPPSTAAPGTDNGDQQNSRSCARIKDLGYVRGKRVNLYGERFKIVSDPFTEDDCVAVRATSGNDPAIKTIRLPVSLLVGLTDLFPESVS